MHLRGVHVHGLVFLLCVIILSSAPYVEAEGTIPIVRQVDAKILYGGCEVDPFDVLIARYSTPRDQNTGGPLHLRPVIGADGTGQNGINPTLACRLMTLFQALEKEQGCLIKIVSGFRSNDEQDKMCGSGGTGCLPAGKSCHNYGLGVDIEGSCVGQLRGFLGKRDPSKPGAQRFGLHFPYSGDHLQCVENPVANCRSGNGCDGKFNITADLSNFPTSVPPTAAFANAIRQWFTPQAAVPSQPAIPSQPVSQSQSPLQAFQDNTAAPAEIGGVSSQIGGSTQGSGSSSAADLLENLAFGPHPATSTASATSVPLIVSGEDAAALSGTQAAVSTQSGTSQGVSSPSQTTFISGDLSWQGGQSGTISSAPVTGWQAILVALKSTLSRIAQYLIPFGSRELQIDGSGGLQVLE